MLAWPQKVPSAKHCTVETLRDGRARGNNGTTSPRVREARGRPEGTR